MVIQTQVKASTLSRIETIFLFLIGYFLFLPSAQAVPNVADMIVNIAATVPSLMYFTTALAYVFGFWLVFHGLILLKKYGEQRTQMSGESKLSPPLLNIFVGAALIYLPSSINAGLSTFWVAPNPYGYDTSSKDEWAVFLGACFNIIQLVGVIAFMRGLIMVTHLGSAGGQQGGFGRAIAHIIGGILCINMYQFVQAVLDTLGLEPLSF